MPDPITHARAAILSMGDELSLGQRLDTNSQWLSRQLVDRGIVPVEHVTLPDDLDAAVNTLTRLASRVDLILATGGLGPTADDLTRDAVAQASGETLVEDLEALDQIRAFFKSQGREMPANNRAQARRPARGRCLKNDHGTAPGIFATIDRCDVFCLPGPPPEMKPMFAAHVAPALRPPAGRTVRTCVLNCFGLGESDLATRLGPLMDRARSPLVGTTASDGVVSIRIRYEGHATEREIGAMLAETEKRCRDAAGPYIFSTGETTLAGAVIAELTSRRQTLAVVESCTGGLLGEMLTEVPGSSSALLGGWITYSNEMKTREVGVSAELIARVGAVSREVAEAMAAGGLERSGADHCLAITGIAGPDGGTPDKPVGTVWISLASSLPLPVGEGWGEGLPLPPLPEGGGWGVGVSHPSQRQGQGQRKGQSPLPRPTSPPDTRLFRMTQGRQQIREWSAKSALMMLWMRLHGIRKTLLLRERA